MIHILILGAGFGGINAVLKLEKKLGVNSDFKITLVDRNNFHLFTPSLYEVATTYGLIEDKFTQYLRGSVAIPIGEVLKDKKINFIQGETEEINLKDKFVVTGGGVKFDFDYLVIALGGETEFYKIPGVREYAFNFRGIDDAIAIYKKIRDLYDETAAETKIAVIGGGFTGVELAAELGCCVKNIIKACKLNKDCTKISLFEAGSAILPALNERPGKIIEKRLKKLGVIVNTNSAVTEVGPNFIKLRDRGEVQNFDLIIWAGGVRGSRLIENLGLKLTKKRTIEVNEFLQTRRNFSDENLSGQIKNSGDLIYENIFAIGDSVTFFDPKTQKTVPAMAYVAHDQADIAAENIFRLISKRNLRPYKPFYDVWTAPVGGKWAYFHYKGLNIAGFWGYVLRQLVDFRYFLRILPLNKVLALFFKDLVIFTKND